MFSDSVKTDDLDWLGQVTSVTAIVLQLGKIFGLIWLGSKVWEIADIWMLPDSIQVVFSHSQKISPSLYSYEYKSDVPGIHLQWQF
ncbi:MAG: hypothetical protein OXK80_03800 [Bdellovibrionales bacterium]|nr:hypothetical protein [Bdellovibrionales bacterium]